MPVAYFTDAEGRWERLLGFLSGNPGVSLVEGRLTLTEGWVLVFGGDAIDRGPEGRRLVRLLLGAKHEYGDRVVLLAGNRDINKLRLVRELDGHPHPRSPAELHRNRPELLRWILKNTMGAAEAFAHRHLEIGPELKDDDVVESFLSDLSRDGDLREYLRFARLAWRDGRTLYVHGGVTSAAIGNVPGHPKIEGVDTWLTRLNGWYAEQIEAFDRSEIGEDGLPRWAPLVAYQAPVPGTRANQGSVVYGRTADEHNDPRLPEADAIVTLREAGIDRLVVGHTPAGDLPAVLRGGGLTLVMADGSYSRLEAGSRVLLDETSVEIGGRTRLDDGRELAVGFRVGADEGEIGLQTGEGRLVVGRSGPERLLFRARPERVVEQTAAETVGGLEEASRL